MDYIGFCLLFIRLRVLAPPIYLILLAAFSSLIITLPLIILLLNLLLPTIHRTRPQEESVINSQDSIIVPYDPCVSITPGLYSSSAITTAPSAMCNSPCYSKRRSLTGEYFRTVLGVEKKVPLSAVIVVGDVKEPEDEHPRSSVNRQQKLMKSIEKSFKTRDKNSSSSYREKARNSVRLWSTLSNEISCVIQNVKRNIPRPNTDSISSEDSVSSEEGFEEDSEEYSNAPTRISMTSLNKETKTPCANIVSETGDDLLEHSGAAPRTNSVPSDPSSKKKIFLSPWNGEDSLPRRFGRSLIKPGSIRKKGRSFLSSLEDMLQKTASRKAAACMQREVETEEGAGTSGNERESDKNFSGIKINHGAVSKLNIESFEQINSMAADGDFEMNSDSKVEIVQEQKTGIE